MHVDRPLAAETSKNLENADRGNSNESLVVIILRPVNE